MDETFSLHQSIPTNRENLKIAGVGSGSGSVVIWLIELSKKLPKSAQLDGFNLEENHFPPKQWHPSNVTIHKVDVFSTMPADFVGKYDIVHLRWFVNHIKEDGPVPLLRNMISMLKPGGYIQWDEHDPIKKIVPADPALDPKTVPTALRDSRPVDDPMSDPACEPSWVTLLADTFAGQGLLESRRYRYPHDNVPATDEEDSTKGLDRTNKEDIDDPEKIDPKLSVAIHRDKVIVVGRKPTIQESRT